MKLTTTAIGLLAAIMSMPAVANDCAADVQKVSANLTSSAPVTPDQLKRAKQLRDTAVTLCAAGDVNGGLALLAEAKTILKIQ